MEQVTGGKRPALMQVRYIKCAGLRRPSYFADAKYGVLSFKLSVPNIKSGGHAPRS